MTPRPTFVQHHISPSDEAMWNPMGKVWANAVQRFPARQSNLPRVVLLTAQGIGFFTVMALIIGAIWSATSQ